MSSRLSAVTLLAVLLGAAPAFAADVSAFDPDKDGTIDLAEAQAAANERGLGAQAQQLGLRYQVDGRDSGNSFDMHRLLHWALELGRQEALLDALYAANFAEPEPAFGSRDRLVAIAESAGFDAAAARAVLDDPEGPCVLMAIERARS